LSLDSWDCGAVALPIRLGTDVGGWALETALGTQRIADADTETDWTPPVKVAEGTDEYGKSMHIETL